MKRPKPRKRNPAPLAAPADVTGVWVKLPLEGKAAAAVVKHADAINALGEVLSGAAELGALAAALLSRIDAASKRANRAIGRRRRK